jgi:hypothetical protein
MPTEPIRRNQRPERRLSLAGFQMIMIGRFWATAEDRLCSVFVAKKVGYRALALVGVVKERNSLMMRPSSAFSGLDQNGFDSSSRTGAQ